MNIAVIGAGSWGTTLAVLLHENGHDVTLWSFEPEVVRRIRDTGRNADYLPDLVVPAAVAVTDDVAAAYRARDMLVVATPSQYVRETLSRASADRLGTPIVVNVAKGIERDSLKRMSEVVRETLPGVPASRYAVLSGPSHAEEVSERKATTVVAASADPATCRAVQRAFMNAYFRVYGGADVAGVELGGSVKNVIAIAAGICDGARFGDNTKAALITRGIAEIRRLGIALGADPHTFSGLSGLGDLIVTTMSRHSRNRYVGEEIGKGRPIADILGGMKMVAEGVETTRSTIALAVRTEIEMPIAREVFAILFEEKNPVAALEELMTREARDENWS